MFLTLFIFLLILGLLIFVHELGHFVMAKKFGMKVEEFGFGFPPRLFAVKRKETIYSVNLIPLGGFVKIQGEDGGERQDPRSFASQSYGKRALTLVAGVLMNIVLATVLISAGYKIGSPQMVEGDVKANIKNPKVQILEVNQDSPAAAAGLEVGDTVREINGQTIKEIEDVQQIINMSRGHEATFLIERGKNLITLKGTPRVDVPAGDGPMGVGLVKTAIISYSLPQAIKAGVIDTGYAVKFIAEALYNLVVNIMKTGKISADLSGPVGVAVMTGRATALGFVYLMQFTALLSINLAIINILPFPALDGGRLLFLGIEAIGRKPINQKVERMVNSVGFALLILLMVMITFRDVIRFGIVDKLKGIF